MPRKNIEDAFCTELKQLLKVTGLRSPPFNLKTVTINGESFAKLPFSFSNLPLRRGSQLSGNLFNTKHNLFIHKISKAKQTVSRHYFFLLQLHFFKSKILKSYFI